MSVYGRLYPYLRPHRGRMAGAIAANMVSAILDGFTLALLIPFLNTLFDQAPLPLGGSGLSNLLRNTVGLLLDPTDKMGSLRNVISTVFALRLPRNRHGWFAVQRGSSLQHCVTRDLRQSVYAHIVHLPLGFFQRTKPGQLRTRVIVDTAETRLVITQIVTS